MKSAFKYLLLATAFGVATSLAQSESRSQSDDERCDAVAKQVFAEVTQDKSEVLEIVAKAVEENEICAGEIVKAAIEASEASNSLVGQIVETAGNAAPAQINRIVTFAIAAAPGAAAEINAAAAAVIGNSDPGDFNPLDAPGGTPPGIAVNPTDVEGLQPGPGRALAPGPVVTPTPVVTDPDPSF